MARGYTVNGPNASGSATKTGVAIIAGTTVRPRLFDLIIGNSATPADQAALHAVTRFTAVGAAGSNPTPSPNDPADVSAIATAGITYSAENTYSAVDLLQIPLNQRASFRWVASPGYELVAPATANNGLGCRLVSATAAMVCNYQAQWFE